MRTQKSGCAMSNMDVLARLIVNMMRFAYGLMTLELVFSIAAIYLPAVCILRRGGCVMGKEIMLVQLFTQLSEQLTT